MELNLVRYTDGSSRPSWGVLADEGVHDLSARPAGGPALADLADDRYLERVSAAVDGGGLPRVPHGSVRALAPVPRPGKIVCVGLNYHDHAAEQGEEPPDEPVLFSKAPTAVTNPGAPVVHPPGERVDYEVELGVVIGRTAREVPAGEVDDYVAGYTVVNDVSGREAQFADGQWFRGKSYDTFAPMGPSLVAGTGYDPNAVDVETRVDGEVRQSSNTAEFVFDVHELVEYASTTMTLRPGDVVATGTPGGVGVFMDPPALLEPGQTVACTVEGVGTLENPVVDGGG
jgi:2-keto-4-pentenoate hydratase/2-oxohepta-3-ene-1,7-dioic acid hydratase in catechol pathway